MQTNARQQAIEALLKKGNYNYITYEKLAFSRSQGKYVLFLRADRYVSLGKLLTLENKVRGTLKQLEGRLKLVVRQPAEELEHNAELFARTVKDVMIASEPAVLPFVADADVLRDGMMVDMRFSRELAPDMVARMHLPERVEKYFADCFDMNIKLRELSAAMGMQAQRDDGCARVFEHAVAAQAAVNTPEKQMTSGELPAKVIAAPSPVKKIEAQRREQLQKPRGKALFGKEVHTPPVPIRDLVDGEVQTVCGEVISSELKPTKNGKGCIVLFSLTDYTSSVSCKLFARTPEPEFAGELKPGKMLTVRGKYYFEERFARAFILEVTDMQPAPQPEAVRDHAEKKRVELHLHTNMSMPDGISSASSYIKRAAEWGHRAVAITDHGVVQAFPEAAAAGKKNGVKILYGVEAYMIDDSRRIYEGVDRRFCDEFVVVDIETTGQDPVHGGITEIGAVRVRGGKIVESFSTFVDAGLRIPPNIVALTGITNDMIAGAPGTQAALEAFWTFAGDACLVAHNASFDMSFIKGQSERLGMAHDNDVLDTLAFSRALLPDLASHKLNKLAAHYRIPLEHHRALNDAECTAKILLKMFAEAEARGCASLHALNLLRGKKFSNREPVYHVILLCKNKPGLVNLYKLVSMGHLEYFYRRPRIPKSAILQHRDGLIIGSACEQGELFQAMKDGAAPARVHQIAGFYDYLEIQPYCNNAFMVRSGRFSGREDLDELNRRIYALGRELGKPVVATTDCHFLNPRDECFRRVIMDARGFDDVDEQAPLYYKTTDEMLAEFSYLGEQGAMEVVVENPNAIADSIDVIELFPGETAMPQVDGAAEDIERIAWENIRKRYGDPLPELIERRLKRELGSIIRHGFSVLYWIAMKLVEKSMSDGYLVGSRGSVGSSLAAYALGITEVNPLPPHYLCTACKYSDFDIKEYGCGVDMPPAVCPKCGRPMVADGYDIPFEVFLGIDADKVPDIDLNFSGEYQPKAHKFIEELFGQDYVYRAGTINAMKDKTAARHVRAYFEKRGQTMPPAEIERLAQGMCGVKQTTGQHPGGLVIVPRDREIFEFTPIQKPADATDKDAITTHFDFGSMHDILVKLDILGHDNPTIIRMLQDLIGFDPLKIPLNDPDTLSLFSSTKALGISPEDIRGVDVGTLGIPEFGTPFVRGMLADTRPKTMAELVRISGLSHGTDVWNGNAKDLIDSGITTLSGAICTRDDIMNDLVKRGVEQRLAFFTMESVRKGKGLKEEMEAAMREVDTPEWFIDSCKKIKYMFPKAHAVAYVVMALRIAYCKVHYPAEFYATYFTVRAPGFDASLVKDGTPGILANLRELEAKGFEASAVEKETITTLEMALEMYARGIAFLPVDLQSSHARRCSVEGGNVRLPFLCIPKLGEKAADSLEKARDEGNILSVEDLKKHAHLSMAVIDAMRALGCLKGLPESAQLSIFDVM